MPSLWLFLGRGSATVSQPGTQSWPSPLARHGVSGASRRTHLNSFFNVFRLHTLYLLNPLILAGRAVAPGVRYPSSSQCTSPTRPERLHFVLEN